MREFEVVKKRIDYAVVTKPRILLTSVWGVPYITPNSLLHGSWFGIGKGEKSWYRTM